MHVLLKSEFFKRISFRATLYIQLKFESSIIFFGQGSRVFHLMGF